ncbi:MAG TPA: YheC/YheD family protein [Bacillota bacterium]|nr:YheC/YheD family protein [Bacillota bacterium]
MSRPVLGVLFSSRDWRGFLSGTGKERLDLYLKAAQNRGLRICFFRVEDIDLKSMKVRATVRTKNDRWLKVNMRLPQVIHNRTVHRVGTAEGVLKTLESRGIIIFNSWNNYGKLRIHRYIYSNPVLRRYLPETCRFTQSNLKRFLEYNSFFVKPDRGSVGRGVIKVSRLFANRWIVTRQVKDRTSTDLVRTDSLYRLLNKYTGRRRHLLQEAIKLLTYKGSPIDIRVAAQRDGSGKWQITGMAAKAARKGGYLTNVFQGGTVIRLDELFTEPMHRAVTRALSNAALEIAEHLSRRLPHLADVGFDFGISRDGKVYFIEMNFRDQRYSLMLAQMPDAYYRAYDNPVAYGQYLLTTMKGRSSRRSR